MNRWPTVFLLAALIGALAVADARRDGVGTVADAAPAATGPVAASDASGSTWYCAAGFITPDATNDHVLTLTNRSDVSAIGTITMYPSLFDTLGDPVVFDRAVQEIEVAPGAQSQISLAPLVASLDPLLGTSTGAFVGALVEFRSTGAVVEHTVIAPQGRDSGPCATSAASTWWFASGTTTAEVRYLLYLLNPFPDDAVVDIGFVTDEGSRNPPSFDGRLVPAQSLTVLDVTPVVPVWEQVTAEVTTLSGRVIAERIQLFDNEMGPRGLSLSLGANQLSEQWFFPAGGAAPGAGESYLIFNPGDEPAEVEFEIKPDSADRSGDVAPLPVIVGARERWIVNVRVHETHPVDAVASIDARSLVELDETYFVTIRSFNGVPVVAERVITFPVELGSGVASSLGATVAATDQRVGIPLPVEAPIVADGDGDGGDGSDGNQLVELRPDRSGSLAVLNPAGDTISRLQVFVGGDGGEELRAEVELAPRRRAVFSLTSLEITDERWIRVVSTTGTIAELVTSTRSGLIVNRAIPTQGTTSEPDLLAFD